MKKIFKAFNNQEGRFNRFEFWVYTILIELTLLFIIGIIIGITMLLDNSTLLMFTQNFAPVLTGFGLLYITFTAYIKRLHDLNKTGWLSLLIFVPIINIILFIYCGFIKGTTGVNKFGPEKVK